MERTYAKITVTVKGENHLRGGHPWVYGEEITAVEGSYQNGGLVDVYSGKGRYIGTGFINDMSKIRVRIISRNTNDRFDEAFYRRRVKYALDYRRTVMREDFASCRIIFGEADGFPGLTVDKYGDVLVAQIACLGIEQIKDGIYKAIIEQLTQYGQAPSVIYERNELALREKEGLERTAGFYMGEGSGKVIINENSLRFTVDYINGQKTGYFLDQRYNRAAAASIAGGLRVLDCFTHTGSFAIHAAAGGAKSVTAVDVSEDALRTAALNAEMNGLSEQIEFVKADVFDYLSALAARNENLYDYIILDPPAFTKSGSTLKNAVRGYKEINMKAMKILPRGGYLATCSCSHFMTEELFKGMLADAAKDASVSLRQIESRRQSPDHPILWGVPETDYLKFYLFQIV